MASPSSSSYFTDVLRGLGATPQAISGSVPFLNTWAGREGVPQAIDAFNLLGTTLPLGGSHGTNAPGVQSYPDYQTGVSALTKMLSQPNFTAIKRALLSGNPANFANDPNVQNEFRSWSGGGYSWPTSSAAPPALPAAGSMASRVPTSPVTTGSASAPASSGPNLAAILALVNSQQQQPQLDMPSWSNVPATQPSLLPLLLASMGQTAPAASAPSPLKPGTYAPVPHGPAPPDFTGPAEPMHNLGQRSLASVAGVQVDNRILPSVLQIIKSFGVTPTSGLRSAAHNAEVGGAPNSDHLTGDAVDFSGSPAAMRGLYNWAQGKFPYVEPWAQSKNHVHISFIR